MSGKYTKKSEEVLKCAKTHAMEKGSKSVGSEHILLGILEVPDTLAYNMLHDRGITVEKVLNSVNFTVSDDSKVAVSDREGYTPRAKRILGNASSLAKKFDSDLIGTEHILMAIITERDCVALRILLGLGLDDNEVYSKIITTMGYDPNNKAYNDLNFQDTSSKTPTLDKYSRDLTAMAAEGELDPMIGREEELERVIQILSRRTKNNPCLVGDPGVGKTAIVEGLAQRMAEGSVPDTIAGKRLVSLDLPAVVAGTKYRGEFEERLKRIIKEVSENKNIILFLDEIHTIIGAGNADGAIDASNMLKPSLARGELTLIGATTIDEYKKHIEKNAALERRFQPVTVEEPTEEAAIEILNGLKLKYEEFHNVNIDEEAIKAAVTLSKRYITDRFLPDKALDIIDEACSKIRLDKGMVPDDILSSKNKIEELISEKEDLIKEKKFEDVKAITVKIKNLEKKLAKREGEYETEKFANKPVIDKESVASVVSQWTKIPLNQMTETETERLINLEPELQKAVIGQEEAIKAVVRAIKRGRAGIADPNRPLGSFMFLGPTGVGKTETAKAIARALFGTEKSLIRVDMTEYMEKHTVSKLIGSPPGYVGFDEGGQLTDKVRRNPYSVVLFDEIEKAHPDIFNVLLQVLDDGYMTDSQGRKTDFKNTVIIMTSNLGARHIVEPKKLGFNKGDVNALEFDDMKKNVMEELKKAYKPEFLNRIDEIIVFHQLDKENMNKIVSIMIESLNKRLQKSKDISLKLDKKAYDYLIEKGFDIKYGARPLRRQIQRDIEDILADKIILKEINPGDTVKISVDSKRKELTFKI